MNSKSFKDKIHNGYFCHHTAIHSAFSLYSNTKEGRILKQVFNSISVILLVCLCGYRAKVSAATTAIDSNKVNQLIAEGDNFSEKVFDDQKALDKFNEAFSLSPNNYEILWRLSRTYADIGAHLPNKTDAEQQKQLEFYEKSVDFAQKAIAANPKRAMGYTRRAIANGRIALFKGPFKAPGLVKQTKADCEKAISLDPLDATAYYVLGRSHAKVMERSGIVRWAAGLDWASMDDAIKNYEKSIELRPDFIMYRLDCARAYIELDDYNKARNHLTIISTLPKENEDDDIFRKEALDLLETIKNK